MFEEEKGVKLDLGDVGFSVEAEAAGTTSGFCIRGLAGGCNLRHFLLWYLSAPELNR